MPGNGGVVSVSITTTVVSCIVIVSLRFYEVGVVYAFWCLVMFFWVDSDCNVCVHVYWAHALSLPPCVCYWDYAPLQLTLPPLSFRMSSPLPKMSSGRYAISLFSLQHVIWHIWETVKWEPGLLYFWGGISTGKIFHISSHWWNVSLGFSMFWKCLCHELMYK